ncbi:MAG: ribonucleoside-triphosphate reductase, adenosylcobalamin-dependent [Candidatus Endolissoclinum sp. TMED37]|nr:MAG: ribonucleoside-triphosphate reductase, adenosylcobalamin-dependent [Candidatus Endolissoclinum sp. TMED37]
MVSTRAEVITRRTYNRPLDNDKFETWEETVSRVISHQRWLWIRAKKHDLTYEESQELAELKELLLERKVSVAGRTLWLGGTEVSKKREASQFNCSFLRVETVYDVVDAFWLLLQGCGVGFQPITGSLNGFQKPIHNIEVIRTKRKTKGGRDDNIESYDKDKKLWKVSIGDSAESWCKGLGKLLAGKYDCEKLVIDFSEIRPEGSRLSGYGWISQGDKLLSKAFLQIVDILNRRSGNLLSHLDILDIVNWVGTVLSSRRSAEICLLDYNNPEWEDFAKAKKDHFNDNPQRSQSNNSLVFHQKPTKAELHYIFKLMEEAGGSEPGFVNAEAAKRKAPWFKGGNPCFEILLGNKNFCNLVECDLGKFNGDWEGLLRAIYLIARANYRQTCVNLKDGVLADTWHELNNFLRLCGVGLTGIVSWEHCDSAKSFKGLREIAVKGAESMAEELNMPRPKAVTTVKPSGTLSKIMDTTEGVHKPLGKYIFNNINFSKSDPLVEKLKQSNYKVMDNPYDDTSVLVTFPVCHDNVDFTEVDGKEVNLEAAINQLDRYKLLMENYVDHNCSVTISYDKKEVPAIIEWLLKNWDIYIGVSFLYRNDPTKSASDLGYPYLPQEVVTKEEHDEYVKQLEPIDINSANSLEELKDDECATGACPVR